MVDFQSRDSRRRRSVTEDDADEAAPEDTNEVSAEDGDDTTESTADDETVDASGVSAAVVTVSADRTRDDDPSGDAIVDGLESAGHSVVTREILRPRHDTVQQAIDALVKRTDVDTVVVTGGSGVGPRDVTVDAVHPLIDRGLPGFGELFRRRYAEQVGTDVVGTRATAGISGDVPVFCLPADAEGVRIGTEEIIAEQAASLVDQVATDEE